MKAVITYGTFDLFHYGHWNLLERASTLGDHLYIFVSTDTFNESKGKNTIQEIRHRIEVIESLRFVYKVDIEESWEQKVMDIMNLGKVYDEVIFVIGDDWIGKFDDLPCKVIYLPRTPKISSTKIKEILK